MHRALAGGSSGFMQHLQEAVAESRLSLSHQPFYLDVTSISPAEGFTGYLKLNVPVLSVEHFSEFL